MSFYAKLDFNNDNPEKTYTIQTDTGKIYTLDKKIADLKIDQEDRMIIFTKSDNYRMALNWDHIVSVEWDTLE